MGIAIRSIFWLGIVFTAMPWTDGQRPLAPGEALTLAANAAQSAVGQGARKSAAIAGEHCAASPAECLAAARKLDDLFTRVATETGFPGANSGTLDAADRAPAWRGQ